MNYDYMKPQAGDELLVSGIRFTVALFSPATPPKKTDAVLGHFSTTPHTTSSIPASQYVPAYEFARTNYPSVSLDTWLANYHAGNARTRIGARYCTARIRSGRPSQYTLKGYHGLELLRIEILNDDMTQRSERTMTTWQWLRLFDRKSG